MTHQYPVIDARTASVFLMSASSEWAWLLRQIESDRGHFRFPSMVTRAIVNLNKATALACPGYLYLCCLGVTFHMQDALFPTEQDILPGRDRRIKAIEVHCHVFVCSEILDLDR